MELFNTFKDAFATTKFIDQAEKNTQAMLSYIQPKEVSKTLVTLTSAISDFARAQVETFDVITATIQKQAEELAQDYKIKATKK